MRNASRRRREGGDVPVVRRHLTIKVSQIFMCNFYVAKSILTFSSSLARHISSINVNLPSSSRVHRLRHYDIARLVPADAGSRNDRTGDRLRTEKQVNIHLYVCERGFAKELKFRFRL